MPGWDPDSYLHFSDERTRPSIDLVSRIRLDAPRRVVDLGCGPGNSTQVLRRRWPDADIWGVDNSAEMIASATEAYPEQRWVLGGIEAWEARPPVDVAFSNAALQWLPGHAALVRRLFGQVAEGGALAFQIPSREYSAVRRFIDEIAHDEAWVARMGAALSAITIETPSAYYDALAPLATSVDLWETEYHHVMDSPAAIVRWISSTGLRPFLDALATDDERERFLALLTERVTAAYLPRSDGRVLFPFRRTFVIAYA